MSRTSQVAEERIVRCSRAGRGPTLRRSTSRPRMPRAILAQAPTPTARRRRARGDGSLVTGHRRRPARCSFICGTIGANSKRSFPRWGRFRTQCRPLGGRLPPARNLQQVGPRLTMTAQWLRGILGLRPIYNGNSSSAADRGRSRLWQWREVPAPPRPHCADVDGAHHVPFVQGPWVHRGGRRRRCRSLGVMEDPACTNSFSSAPHTDERAAATHPGPADHLPSSTVEPRPVIAAARSLRPSTLLRLYVERRTESLARPPHSRIPRERPPGGGDRHRHPVA